MFNIQTTEEYKTLEELQKMDDLASSALNTFILYTRQAYNIFWYGEVSPIIKVQMLGTKALEVFTASAQAQAFIKSQKPDYVELTIPEKYTITWNKDGSAKIEEVEEEIVEIPNNDIETILE